MLPVQLMLLVSLQLRSIISSHQLILLAYSFPSVRAFAQLNAGVHYEEEIVQSTYSFTKNYPSDNGRIDKFIDMYKRQAHR